MLFDNYGDLLNLTDLSEILDVKPATAARLCRSGKIKAFKAGREWRTTKLALEAYVLSESYYQPLA
ncbi:helix-turn-helix domain-containing protein [Clostridium transplantifaecale]|uniref:helix-turn-helix domain-containing protein n=1 Tax=Clostridium transplantifaecale TaxID=2479838 RepID=UPI000F64093C|nr:helix-turn-helix domain-containing protein [Clostridium transplantifaecale]